MYHMGYKCKLRHSAELSYNVRPGQIVINIFGVDKFHSGIFVKEIV